MPKLESVLENAAHKILWDFEIQTDHQIPVKRPGQNTEESPEDERRLAFNQTRVKAHQLMLWWKTRKK